MKNPTINVLLDAGAAIIIASAFLTSAAPSGIELAAQEAPKWFGDVHELTLVDGTSLAGTITAHTSQVITLITRDGATIGIPVRLIRTIDGKAFPDSSLNAFWSSTGEAGGSGLTTAEQRPLKSQASGDSSVAGNKNLRSDSGESANALAFQGTLLGGGQAAAAGLAYTTPECIQGGMGMCFAVNGPDEAEPDAAINTRSRVIRVMT